MYDYDARTVGLIYRKIVALVTSVQMLVQDIYFA